MKNLTLFIFILLITSCMGGGERKVDCRPGTEFNPVGRTCEGIVITEMPPTPITDILEIDEDDQSLNSRKSLEYIDINNDLATSCRVYSDSPGLVKRRIIEGILFESVNSLNDPHNIFVRIIRGSTFSINTSTTNANLNGRSVTRRYIDITYNNQTSTDITTALLANTQVTSWVNVLLVTPKAINEHRDWLSINQIDCQCTNTGICFVDLSPTANYNGESSLQYTVTDNDGESDLKRVSINIISINDIPTATDASLTINEDQVINLNLVNDLGVVVEDASDGDPAGALLQFVLATVPANGTVNFLNANGDFRYTPNLNYNGTDSFGFRVIDPDGGASLIANVTITINPVDDSPIATLTSIGNFDEDTSFDDNNPVGDGLITLTGYDPDNSGDIIGCYITNANKVYLSSQCLCDNSVCKVGLTAINNQFASGSFDYVLISNETPYYSDPQTVTFTINPVVDVPFAHGLASVGVNTDSDGNIRFLESSDHIGRVISFQLLPAIDVDQSGDTLVYNIVSMPENGTLSDCLGLNASANDDLSCNYRPYNGNISDVVASPSRATLTLGDLTINSKLYGSSISSQIIEFIDIPTIRGLEFSIYRDNKVVVFYKRNHSNTSSIANAINNGPDEVTSLITATATNTSIFNSAPGDYNLMGSVDVADKFTYNVHKRVGGTDYYSLNRVVNISIVPVDDNPILCEYSSFSKAPECGTANCVGTSSPIGEITPTRDGIYYYDSQSSICYRSDLLSPDNWVVSSGHISDQISNEQSPIIIDNLKIDEGGPDANENNQQMSIVEVTSSNSILIPVGQIDFYYRGVLIGNGSSSMPILLNDGTTSADANDFRIVVDPRDGQNGTATITIAISDGNNRSEIEFDVTIYNYSSHHGGWKNIMATGPSTDIFSRVVDNDKDVCSYSLDRCENGRECVGNSSPINNNSADPDHLDTIYFDKTNNKCYKIDKSSVAVSIGDIDYYPLTNADINLNYIAGGVAGSEVVSVSGNNINVTIADNISTTNAIILAIENHSVASRLIRAENKNLNSPQRIISSTTISGVRNSNWQNFSTKCMISTTIDEPNCSSLGLNCRGNGAPSFNPSNLNSFYWDEENNICYRSFDGPDANNFPDGWQTYIATGETTLVFNAFNILGGAVASHYNVYRKLPSEEFDFQKPINREPVSKAVVMTYLDNAINSTFAPVPGTVYFYQVRPVIQNIATDSSENYKTIRVLVPPDNMSFVHRWIVNQRICSMMNKEVDPNNNFSCRYEGPGDTGLASGSNRYDIGYDLLVDRFEAGCAYTSTTSGNDCSTDDGSCIGQDEPYGTITADTGAIYYNRSSGRCYVNTSTTRGTDWKSISGVDFFENYNKRKLPPLVWLTQLQAANFCASSQRSDISIMGINTATVTARLPSRKQQITYSIWDSSLSTNVINARETGLSLNSSSKCNTSKANGLEVGFFDVDIPDSNNFYSLPGNYSSDIRSLITGSDKTIACNSNFAVQDTIGNVSEWSSDRITCSLSECDSVISGNSLSLTNLTTNDFRPGTGSDDFSRWNLDGETGPCASSNGTDCDGILLNWIISDENYGAGSFFVPMGLPAYTDFLIDNPDSVVIPYMLEIGPTSGILSANLHQDKATINSHHILAESSRCGAISSGGNYRDENAAGIWNLSIKPCNDVIGVYSVTTIGEISFKATSETVKDYSISIVDNVSCAGSGITTSSADKLITIDLGCIATDTATNVVTIFNNNSSNVEAIVTGDGSATVETIDTSKALSSISTSLNDREFKIVIGDIGFRAITLDGEDYSILIVNNGGCTNSITVNTAAESITIDLGCLTDDSALNVTSVFNQNNNLVEAVVIGNPSAIQSVSASSSLSDATSLPKAVSNDTGFRCVYPIDYSIYTE